MTGPQLVIMTKVLRDGNLIEAQELTSSQLDALSDETRQKIIRCLAENPSYPRQVSRDLGIPKQRAYYHFNKLEDSGLINEFKTEDVSGGSAEFYKPSSDAYVFDTGARGNEEVSWRYDRKVRAFLDTEKGRNEPQGFVVAGSPDQHGPDQVKARDGHLLGEIGLTLGEYGVRGFETRLDTEVMNRNEFENNIILLGGVLTNTITKEFNQNFEASFEGEEFPYRKIETPKETYTKGEIGVIAKAENPLSEDNWIIMVAGIQNRGTKAAVTAFSDLENLLNDWEGGEFYCVVEGLDNDGDGKIDSYEVKER